MLGSGMPIINAVGSSLLSVGIFGLTAANYALSGMIDWTIAGSFIAGGAAGGLLGVAISMRIAPNRRVLSTIFSIVVFAVAAYMMIRSVQG